MVENIDEVLNYVSLCKDLNTTLDNIPTFESIDDYDDKELINKQVNEIYNNNLFGYAMFRYNYVVNNK